MRFNLIYLTPQQKDIFDHYPHLILRGHAGCGKTVLSLLKVVEVLQKNSNDQLVLVAPSPHHLRSLNYLRNNSIHADVVKKFLSKLTRNNLVMF